MSCILAQARSETPFVQLQRLGYPAAIISEALVTVVAVDGSMTTSAETPQPFDSRSDGAAVV